MTPAQYIPTFVKDYTGKAVDFDKVLGDTGQCVQLVAQFLSNLKLPVFYAPYAVDWWTEFKGSDLAAKFEQIACKPGVEPQPGDLVVFGASDSIDSPEAGHIDICLKNSTSTHYTGFDSNWGGVYTSVTIDGKKYKFPAAHQVVHTYEDVLGYLRVKAA